MPSAKLRLYVALYPSGVVNNEERRDRAEKFNRYHWGLLIGPKNEGSNQVPGKRYHVKNTPVDGWKYEEVELDNVRNTNSLLARILIAKVEDLTRLTTILRSVPVVQDDPNWRCRTWIATALSVLERDGKAVGTSQLN
ncbi:hypothetical protein DOTSEDRAFT_36062 [Dothistroma septosporum NZE10]|uniref:Uncharacterized protein n=1 Tax=Dothistroma septosporum (strain NZE10 / CBS 128990) TaxID=675120 RepID=N1PJ48_DOTSN|nr:hypothetical protein DOTSEDRAFT_36062 [Dothistroma septosporum NZE10]